MNCLIWVLLLLCCGNNGCGSDDVGRSVNRNERRGSGTNDECECGNMNDRGRNERRDDNDCGCRTEFRSEPRFEQRPFVFSQNTGCGCEEQQN